MNRVYIIILILLTAPAKVYTQEDIDLSKPTNIYSRINHNIEYIRLKDNVNFWGYRFNYSYASGALQTTAEVPLL